MEDNTIVELNRSAAMPSIQADPEAIPSNRASANDEYLPPLVGTAVVVKRLFDIVVGSLILTVLMPLFALLSILVKLDSPGPALFYQQRQGRNCQPILVYKFRTMYEGYSTPKPTKESFLQTRRNDPRITRVGAFLRQTSLDELPQLFNVIQGTMSLVGPRPHPKPLDDQYERLIPSINLRYAIKPGITGLAQIHGYRGETRRWEDMAARVDLDLEYIRTRSLWMDIKIVLLTAVKGWAQQNAV